MIISSKELKEWENKSIEGKVCHIYECTNKPIIKCPKCGNIYCIEHSKVHIHSFGLVLSDAGSI